MLNAQMRKCANAQMHKCTNAQMHKCTNAQMHGCTNAQMHNVHKWNSKRFITDTTVRKKAFCMASLTRLAPIPLPHRSTIQIM